MLKMSETLPCTFTQFSYGKSISIFSDRETEAEGHEMTCFKAC